MMNLKSSLSLYRSTVPVLIPIRRLISLISRILLTTISYAIHQASVLEQYMQEMFAECGKDCFIELPFHANWGGHHVHMGDLVYANTNLTLVDDGHIYIGDKVMFGPNVVVATANHPIDAELRDRGLQYNKDVHIGDNTWIGASVVIVPGVTIGKNVIIGAGSIVTKDIPDNVVAVGNPCRVIREVGEHDREYFYKDEKIDWENLG